MSGNLKRGFRLLLRVLIVCMVGGDGDASVFHGLCCAPRSLLFAETRCGLCDNSKEVISTALFAYVSLVLNMGQHVLITQAASPPEGRA